MEELEKLEYPKPNREFIYSTFNAFADKHPWVGQENIRPKSIVREMFESFRSFSDYIRDYELQRAEGVLLRHLNSVYKVLAQTVPDYSKTETVVEMELYLREMIRQVDSSLLEEWNKMRNPEYRNPETQELRAASPEALPADITRDTKAFTAAVRTRIFGFLRGFVNAEFEQAMLHLNCIEAINGEPWTEAKLKELRDSYYSEHPALCLDPGARNLRNTYVLPSEDKKTWRVQQMLIDPDETNDWVAEFSVDLLDSKERGEPVMRLLRLGELAR